MLEPRSNIQWFDQGDLPARDSSLHFVTLLLANLVQLILCLRYVNSH